MPTVGNFLRASSLPPFLSLLVLCVCCRCPDSLSVSAGGCANCFLQSLLKKKQNYCAEESVHCAVMEVLATQSAFNFVMNLCTAVFQQLTQALDQLSINKRACRELADRVKCLRGPLQERAQQLSKVLVERVSDTLQGIETSVKRYIAKSTLQKVLQANKYRHKFEHFHNSIKRLIDDVNDLHVLSAAPRATVPTVTAHPVVQAVAVQVCPQRYSCTASVQDLLHK
jgi:hypothetical protein